MKELECKSCNVKCKLIFTKGQLYDPCKACECYYCDEECCKKTYEECENT